MIRSMTGFGEASMNADGVHYFLELRSLNSRYFKALIRLPEMFQGLEAELESQLRHRLRRGSVTLSATCTDASAKAAYTINAPALGRYIEQLQQVPQVREGRVAIDLGSLLTLPGVLQPPHDEEARLTHARAAYMQLLDRACAGLLEMRAREGAALLQDLIAQRDVMRRHLDVIASRAPQAVADYENRLKARMDMMIKDASLAVQPGDLIREIAVYAERSDISEEIKRLTGHLEQYTELLTANGGQAVGRTLDFLAQEMLREANTIASKSADSDIAKAIVEVKGAIDRIKEQVQNAE
ncbi:MAG: YicC family protein [Phycisphaerae bacterium]|nr:YicC family protein [Phycisphaerae bacterium]